MKSWIQTIVTILTIAGGGWVFHRQVISDIDGRINVLPASYSIESGLNLEKRLNRIEFRTDKRLENIEEDIKKMLAMLSHNGKIYGAISD